MNDRQSALNSAGQSPQSDSFWARWSRDPVHWRERVNFVLFLVLASLAIAISVLIDWPVSSNLQVQIDDISPVDVRAPRTITYQSEVLTEEARERAAESVRPIFDPPQTRIARQQLARAEQVIAFIELVRGDIYASEEQKVEWLTSMAEVELDEEVARKILELDDVRWEVVATELIRVLDRAMRQEIREGELQLARRAVPGLISFGLNDEEAMVVTAVVQDLLRPNTFLNAERTEAAREEAVQNVAPVDRTIVKGETILRSGDRVDALDIEALDVLGLLRTERTWRNYASALLWGLILAGVLVAFVTRRRPRFWESNLQVFLLGILFISFVFLAKLMVPVSSIFSYLYPLAAMAMLIGALIDLSIAAVATMMIGVLVAMFSVGDVQLTTYLMLGALAGALALGKAERLNSFLWAGVWLTIANLAVLAVFSLPLLDTTDSRELLELLAAAVVNGIFASSFTLVIFYLLGQVFGLTTNLQLLELSRPTHPLLRQLLLKAPGTYHHTLIVSNMAEEAASAIGANVLLTRVGSYYHDIGKTVRPYFFIENNTDGMNPHDRLDPYTSARIIISHVTDGVDLARKYRLPRAIIDFIREHHGTTRVEYFYHQACQEYEGSGQVDDSEFRYPGPRPRSRETALLMLADGSEAAVRAMNPATREEMTEIIRSVINRRLMSGQLDHSQLTLQDLSQATDAFVRVLQGIHHPRVKYPSDVESPEKPQQSATAIQPAPAR